MTLSVSQDPSPLGALFAIPASDWMRIGERVRIAIAASPIAGTIEIYVQGFQTLEADCLQWRQSTFPGLIEQSTELEAFADHTVVLLQQLQSLLAGFDSNQALPQSIVDGARPILAQIAAGAARMHGKFATSAAAITAFVGANNAVDARLEQVVAGMSGSPWRGIVDTVAAVDAASGLALGAWRSLSDDLGALASGQTALSAPILESLIVASALSGWRSLKTEAQAFSASAQDEQIRLSQPWSN